MTELAEIARGNFIRSSDKNMKNLCPICLVEIKKGHYEFKKDS